MALRLEDKRAVVAEVHGEAQKALSAVAAEYRGLTVGQMTSLRASARNAGVYLRVVKNTLARRAVEGTDYECMREGFKGPLILAFSREDPGAAARLVKDFAREHDKLVPVMVSLGGRLLPVGEIGRLANLPSFAQALALLMGVMRAPIEKLVRTMAEPAAKLVRTLAAIRDQKQAA